MARPIARLVGRQAIRGVWAWAAGFAFYIAGSLSGFAATYKTAAAREGLARSFGANAGLQALLGPARHIDTAAGFTAWRSLGILGVAGAVWGLLTATRLLRGAEESGRWEMVLAGPVTRRRATAQALAGLAAAWGVLLAVTALLTVGDGQSVHPAVAVTAGLYFSLAVTTSAAMFLAVGALTSQLARTRRRAAGIAGAVLAACYGIRLVADGGNHPWLLWASPLGWVEKLRPLTGSSPWAFLPVAALTLAAALATVHLAGARDLGGATLAEADTAPPRTGLLGNPAGLGVRLLRPLALGWLGAVAGLGFIEGVVAKGAGSQTAVLEKALGRLGAHNSGTLDFLAISFLTIATVIALVAAGQAVANRDEEASGRLDNLLARPLSRVSWLWQRLGPQAGLLVALGVASGVATWVAAATQHSGIGFGALLQAGLNTVAPALFLLGAGAFVQAAAPRYVAPITYGLVAYAFVIEFVGAVVQLGHWALDTSILYHLAPAPAASPDWTSAGALAALGLLAAAAGAAVLHRRDLVGG
ncbi:MAG TPA: ABC transporter permease subunit [Actinomycetota bacterium]|nr:ABC transporter permease subunit [Actinomycetota bacterium]